MPPLPSPEELVRSVRTSAAGDLDRIGAAVVLADELGSLGDQVVTHFVQAARDAGCSWSQIGAQLGVSKQAAHQAFVTPPRSRRRPGRRAPAPFERWTDRARAALDLAHQEAREHGHNYLGTEHLLLGLLREGAGPAAAALGSLGVHVDDVRRLVVDIIGIGARPGPDHPRLTPRTKKVLDLAVREAARLHDDHVGTEHLLLALVREGEGVAAQVLVGLGADLPRVRDAVSEVLRSPGGPRTPGGRPSG